MTMEDNLTKALARNRIEIIRVERHKRRHIYSVRGSTDQGVQLRWRDIINDVLLGAVEEGGKGGWAIDVSKWFFVAGGTVRFCWRVIVSGDDLKKIEKGERFIAGVADLALRTGVEITSMPLIGRKIYPPDSLAGAYTEKEAAQKRASRIGAK